VDTLYPFRLELQSIMFTRLYIHVPFCRQKCPYCAFASRPGDEADADSYAGLLLHEMLLAHRGAAALRSLDSVYFGGGTPSLLSPQMVARLLEQAAGLFGLDGRAEITLEANPGTVDRRKLAGFRGAGINRLSLGVQSFDDRMLAAMGRIHTAHQACEAFGDARWAGFDNIGIDLIHALPGQTPELWRLDLERALALAPEHLSVYGLTLEEGTPFAERYGDTNPLLPDDDLAADMFEMADNLLTAGGYEHYEIANYARPGCRSRHNSGYWRRDGYLGLGMGAHSFLLDGEYGIRFGNTTEPDEYGAAIARGELPRRDITPLSREDALAEFMFLGLRMAEGVSLSDFRQAFGVDIWQIFGKALEELLAQELLQGDNNRLALTRRGMLLSNRVFSRFLA